jgi:hypothetical protein
MIRLLGIELPRECRQIRAIRLWLAFASALSALTVSVSAASVVIDGGKTYQVIEGFGANINHRSWDNNHELQPVLDALIDQAGMTLFRVVYDNTDWETTNDNSNANVMNWDYYGPIYSGPDFQKMWDMIRYLNGKGITNGVMPNFQGFGPDWMSLATDYRSLAPGYENEWAEMIASALVYARYTNHLQFGLVGPNNEPDLPGSGIGIATAAQYVATLRALSHQLDANGMSDLRFVGPDLSNGGLAWLPELIADPVVMGKLGHFGLHAYGNPGFDTTISDFIQHSAYPDRTYWLTEFNVWCDICQLGLQGTNSWEYSRGTAEYLLYHLANNASAALVWEGYDSLYRNNYDDNFHWSSWGLLKLDDPNAVPKTYTPRKGFYTVAQVSKFIRPGARRIDLSGSGAPLAVATYHAGNGQLAIAGVNSASSAITLSATLTNLPAFTNLELYYTDSANNLRHSDTVPLTNGIFTASIPPDCVFSLVSPATSMTNGPILLTLSTNGNGRIFPDLSSRTVTAGETLTLVAVPDDGQGFAGWSGGVTSASPRLTLTLSTNIVLVANFVPGNFSAARGAYTGLFCSFDGVSPASSGLFTLNTTSRGSFSGRLSLLGANYALSGSFDAGGHARVTIRRPRLNPLTVDFQLDLAHNAEGLSGTLTDGNWLAEFSADRATFDAKSSATNSIGRYTLLITGNRASTAEPGGDSFGTITVSKSGQVRTALWLADGTMATQVAPLSRTLEWPLYVPLYGGKGCLAGWIMFTNTPMVDLRGAVAWSKPKLARAKYYPEGYSMNGNAFGSAYHVPPYGRPVPGFFDGQLVLQGGATVASLTNRVSLDYASRVTNRGANRMSMSIQLSSGLFRGTVTPQGGKRPIQFSGVVLQKQYLGRGYFTDTDQTARVTFGPIVP